MAVASFCFSKRYNGQPGPPRLWQAGHAQKKEAVFNQKLPFFLPH